MAKTEVTGSQIKDQSVDLTVDITGVLPVVNGGSGSDFVPLNNVILGNGNGAFQSVAPGDPGNVLTSDGSTWVSLPSVAGQVTLDGEEVLNNKTLTSPVIQGEANENIVVFKFPNGDTAYTINQYGEFFGNAGLGIFYDSNVSTSAFSTSGSLFITSGKSSSENSDIILNPSGNGAINLQSETVKANGSQVATLDSNGFIPLSQWGYQVLDGGSAENTPVITINGGTA